MTTLGCVVAIVSIFLVVLGFDLVMRRFFGDGINPRM